MAHVFGHLSKDATFCVTGPVVFEQIEFEIWYHREAIIYPLHYGAVPVTVFGVMDNDAGYGVLSYLFRINLDIIRYPRASGYEDTLLIAS